MVVHVFKTDVDYRATRKGNAALPVAGIGETEGGLIILGR